MIPRGSSSHCSLSSVYTCLAQVIVFHSDFSEEEIDIVSIFDGMKKVWFWKKTENKPFLRDDSVSVRPPAARYAA